MSRGVVPAIEIQQVEAGNPNIPEQNNPVAAVTRLITDTVKDAYICIQYGLRHTSAKPPRVADRVQLESDMTPPIL
jgi:hypothetical protein